MSALRVALFGSLCSTPVLAQSQPIELPPIVVSATRTDVPLDQVGSSITLITREELERRQIRFVADALRTVPGLSVARIGGVGSQTLVRIRGAEANQTLVLIDGIEVNDPSFGSEFDFANLMTDDIERIEVLRGPQSVLYGSDALGGVVNIITRKGGGPLHSSVAAEGGSFGTARGSASLSGGLAEDRFRYSLSAVRLHTDGISAASERRDNSEKDGYDNGTLSANLGASLLDNLDVDVVGRFTDAEREGDGFVGGVGAVDAEEDSATIQRFGRIQARLALLDGRWQHRVGLSGADSRTDYRTDGQKVSSYDGMKTKIDYQTDLSLSTQALLPADHTVSLGLEQEREEAILTSAFSDFDRSITTRSVYSLYQVALFDDLFLTAGGRFDANDRFEDATTYRLTAAYRIEETGTKLRGSYGTAVKNPTLFDLYGYDANFRPNPNLEPETARGWDAGIDQALFGDRLSIGATYFDQRLDNFVSLAGQTVVNLPGESRIRGVELTAAVALWDGLDLTASYTFTDSQDPDGNKLVRRPRHQAGADLSYRFFEDRATVNLGVIWVGARNDIAFDAAYNQSIVRLDPYTLVNLAASVRVTGNLEAFGRIENLFDENYEEAFTYGTPGRAGYIGLRARF
ncbi:TonB-dependent receptor domain-containing protein [Rhodospirillaceae bacterium SYSU D60014]|uniref:TonB-dependent receptor plug domain-containing protein n=1 Tax=Virgifigura deserti TaxID=2268457 RepID=UPI0013C4607A